MLNYPHNFLKTTASGRIYGQQDIWQCSLNVGFENNDFSALPIFTDSDWRDGVTKAWKDWFTRRTSGIGGYATMDSVKYAVIGTDGKYAVGENDDYDYLYNDDFDAVGGGGTPGTYDGNPAPQLSVALTLLTDNRRGLAKTGRIYPPLTGTPSSIGLDQYNVQRAESFKTLIEDINNAFVNVGSGSLFAPKVVITSGVREGKINVVTGIKVGQVIDTQRRRRSAIPENYEVQDINLPGLGDGSPNT